MAVSIREIMNLPEDRPVKTVLVVDQGDGAVRVLRALREAGVDAVLLCARGPAAPERALAHRVVSSPGLPRALRRPGDVELAVAEILRAADLWGCDAVHFGYAATGQDPRVIGEIERGGLVVLGPSRGALERLGAGAALAATCGLRHEPSRTARVVGVVVAVDDWDSGVALGDRDPIMRADGRVIADCAPSQVGDRDRVWREAVRVALAAGLRGVATVELGVDASGAPESLRAVVGGLYPGDLVVEETTGLDLVAEQLRLASGQPVALHPEARGHGAAIQCRILAIDPLDGDTAERGVVRGLTLPQGAGVRVEPKVAVGSVIDPSDPVIARLACHGRDREAALRRLDTALGATSVVGVRTNVPLLRELLAFDRVHDDSFACPDEAVHRASRRLSEPDHDAEIAIAALLAVHWVRSAAPATPSPSRWHSHGRVLDMGGA